MKRFFPYMLLLLLAFPLCANAAIYTEAPPSENWSELPLFRLTAFAAGESDCMLLECGGESMMVDGGSKPFRDPLMEALKRRGIEKLKYLLNTHFHDDHIDGLYWLMRNGMPAGEYLHPYTDYAERLEKRQARTLQQARHEGIPIRKLENGEEIMLGEAVITVYRYQDGETTNGRSMIEHVRFGDATMLLCADITGITQVYYAENLPKDILDVDVMKMPHHGITPLNKTFMAATSPQVLLITNNEKTSNRTIIQAEANKMLPFCAADRTTVLETDGEDWYVYQVEGFQ